MRERVWKRRFLLLCAPEGADKERAPVSSSKLWHDFRASRNYFQFAVLANCFQSTTWTQAKNPKHPPVALVIGSGRIANTNSRRRVVTGIRLGPDFKVPSTQ